MSSLTDLPELVGFFSYARSDDENSDMALSLLRKRIRSELRLQLGRELRLWQDTEAIPHGRLWEGEIKKAIAESAFFIPIVTPSAVNSSYCRMELEAFLGRESELARDDLIFPIHYIRVPALANENQRSRDNMLKIIHARHCPDWTKIRLDDVASPGVRKQIARFCEDIVEALRKHRPSLPGPAVEPVLKNEQRSLNAAQEWPAVRDSCDPSLLLLFEQRFDGTPYAADARELRKAVDAADRRRRIAELERCIAELEKRREACGVSLATKERIYKVARPHELSQRLKEAQALSEGKKGEIQRKINKLHLEIAKLRWP
jgi:hypothetical protein